MSLEYTKEEVFGLYELGSRITRLPLCMHLENF